MATTTKIADREMDSSAVQRAERDHHECIARYGVASAEAQAAAWIWRQLRARAARARSAEIKPAA